MPKAVTALIMLIVVLSFGTSGYMFLEHSSFMDSLYMTMITISTIGYGEIFPLSTKGRIFTMVLILVGVGLVMFMFSKITEAVVEGELRAIYGRLNMKKKVTELNDHYIICGFGRIGRVICDLLKEANKPFVVVENSPKVIRELSDLNYLFLDGEASSDDMLLKAGVKRAKGLISVVSSDADNVYITLSARGLNNDLYIMARSSGTDGGETKLLRAGANRVISPYYIGACRMAQHILRPTVTDFIDLTLDSGELGLRMEELSVSDHGRIVNKTLMDSNIRRDFNLIVVAIKRAQGEMLFNPNPTSMILKNDTLIVLGEYTKIKELEQIV
ncbi:MAG: NAD-binding protein [Proteobacteria bacterium]|jgi:voltage-gated potassium channel|nr:potassium channel protein [Desulfocapsa sp.]MBU3944809.1 NAD-binding protein [Pseudomonadota bacterium]MCG2745658.1 NAD-binding protein [Desulfobacteraceae bacterium]MBU4029408.1 NAD-binding protein [Pseudomonadota bacterium]MBU4041349.1 NAD-binding protein [Pseudomonadota bacterium]